MRDSRTFAVPSTTTDVSLDLASGIVSNTAASSSPLTFRFDASTNTYTVSVAGRSDAFGPADALEPRFEGEQIYNSRRSRLTLVTAPYFASAESNKYVGLAYWQSNAVSNGIQQSYFTTFAYGFETPQSNIPRTGSAHWTTDIFGLLTIPNENLRVIQGAGDFDVDFDSEYFRTTAIVDEYDFVTSALKAENRNFRAVGSLGLGSAFNGSFTYYAVGSGPGLYGSLSGSFFGPGAEEVGGSFSASGGGAVLTGGFTGQRSESSVVSADGSIPNLSLTSPFGVETLSGLYAAVYWEQREGVSAIYTIDQIGGNSGRSLTYGTTGPIKTDFGYLFDPEDQIVDTRTNFTTYETTIGGIPNSISLYKVGTENSELQLSYMGFYVWKWDAPADDSRPARHQIAYKLFGILTSEEYLLPRSGTATYAGVVYGSGAALNGALYDIGGTSHFDYDFDADSYTGWLELLGQDLSGKDRDFGRWSFDSAVAQTGGTALVGPGGADDYSYIYPQFFGATGAELGATFGIRTGDPYAPDTVHIGGITLAKQQ